MGDCRNCKKTQYYYDKIIYVNDVEFMIMAIGDPHIHPIQVNLNDIRIEQLDKVFILKVVVEIMNLILRLGYLPVILNCWKARKKGLIHYYW